MGRKAQYDRPLTGAQRQQLHREKIKNTEKKRQFLQLEKRLADSLRLLINSEPNGTELKKKVIDIALRTSASNLDKIQQLYLKQELERFFNQDE